MSGDHCEARGAEDVYESIKDRNDRVRGKMVRNICFMYVYFKFIFLQEKVVDEQILQVPSCLFENIGNDWKLSIVDNPGFNESTDYITERAKWSLKHSSACILVTTYAQYQQKDIAKFIESVYKENRG
jgi:hypothetical protein